MSQFQIVILFLIFGFLLGSAVTYLFIRLFWAMRARNVMIDDLKKESTPQYPWERKLETVDLEKRYDIYINGTENTKIIYKNIKIKGIRGLIDDSTALHGNEYFLLEQDDGTEILISNFSISLICLSGTEPKFEIR